MPAASFPLVDFQKVSNHIYFDSHKMIRKPKRYQWNKNKKMQCKWYIFLIWVLMSISIFASNQSVVQYRKDQQILFTSEHTLGDLAKMIKGDFFLSTWTNFCVRSLPRRMQNQRLRLPHWRYCVRIFKRRQEIRTEFATHVIGRRKLSRSNFFRRLKCQAS